MADFGLRPTASPAHSAFIDWLEEKLAQVPGMQLSSVPYTINRWLERGTSLSVGTAGGPLTALKTSGALPYARVTPRSGVTAPLVYIPAGTQIASEDAAGKIVVRDVVPSSTPYRNYNAVAWSKFDPDRSLTTDELSGKVRQRDVNAPRVTDLRDATEAGAAGLIFVQGFSRSQVQSQYAPYEGIHWGIPALYLGADEGAAAKQLAAAGGRGRISISASQKRAPTRMLVATLPGASPERLVVESHTDGVNAVWDNGPIAMLALARHFASLPSTCRPRTLQFIFTTSHLYQRLAGDEKGGSARLVAEQLDGDYDRGSVAMVFALEHLGAREYEAGPRPDGGPGQILEPTGRSEPNTFFAGDSPLLIDAVTSAVAARGLARTYVLRGADAPGARIPANQDFGGEGTSYHRHLIPTIAFVTQPWTLFDPSFGIEAVDGELMRTQTLIFSDLIHRLADQPTLALGGGYVAERVARGLVCGSALASLGFMTCFGGSG